MQRSYNVIIVGAGPAGSALAYELASKGIQVQILEKATLPRYKCCAGGLTIRAAKLLGINLDAVIEDIIRNVTVTFAGNKTFDRHCIEPVMYTVMRDKFDQALVKKAQEAGVTILQGVQARAIQASDAGVRVFTSAGDFECQLAIGADGAKSLLAKAIGIENTSAHIIGIESEVMVAEEELAEWKSRILIDMGCIRDGYGWVFPKADHLSVGIACLADSAKGLRSNFSQFLDSLGFGSHNIMALATGLIPVCVGYPVVAQGRVILLGDAAGLSDPLTGEGIHNAILSAQLAAPAIEESLKKGEARLETYRKLVAEKMAPQMKTAHAFAKVFRLLPGQLFSLLSKDERVWNACCSIMRGETDYQAIKNGAGTLSRLYDLVFGG